jgi:hypothetical protein
MTKVTEFEDSLLNSGITINKLCDTRGLVHGLESRFIDCTGPEIVGA